MQAFVDQLLAHSGIGPKVAHHRRLPGRRARFADPGERLPAAIEAALAGRGIARLYEHQARALDAARGGKNVLAVTPTASGKTLVFALPVLEAVLDDPTARALFLYPTKALAQDQVKALRDLAAGTGGLRPPRFEIYDGDTPEGLRRKIRMDPPEILVTNPDMLHLGILAHHAAWASFLGNLRWVVLDELHVYRGVFGAHVHHILARLRRLASLHGADPRFVAASATIGNPADFGETLVGAPFEVVDRSGAPAAARHVLILNPVTVSPYTLAVRVVAESVRAGLKTIAFTKARRISELIHSWLVREDPSLRRRVAPYRAGYLPEERREIERRLFGGDLFAVVATSALELGIDVSGLDVCVLVGYPGSLMSSWQRIGRVGRQGRDALIVLIAMPDALDQYIVAHPDLFFGSAFEPAVLDPWNPSIAAAHLVCAATEEPLSGDEVRRAGARAEGIVASLVKDRRLVLDASGERWHSMRRRPHRDVNPRSAGSPFVIVDPEGDRLLGTIDGMRVHHECHPGAVYLHAGQSYLVRALDTEARRVEAAPARVDYYTVVLGDKETEILEVLEERSLEGDQGRVATALGRLRVTSRIRGFQKKRLFDGETIATQPLEAPPLVFETVGFWISIPASVPGDLAGDGLDLMGGIHAVEHAAIGLFPLLAIADRGDVGGISYTLHPQVGGPAVFVYDGVPGGAGLAERGFRDLETLLARTRDLIAECACEEGCPACIQSPRCGNGNKPLDKTAASRVLRILTGVDPIPTADGSVAPPPERPPIVKHGFTRAAPAPAPTVETVGRAVANEGDHVLVFDLETQRSAEEVGGWDRADRMGLAVAVVYDERRGSFTTYYEADVDRLLLDLALADRVVGFNIDRFDLAVLSGYTDKDLRRIRTLDMLSVLHDTLGFRPSLGHLSEVNLGEAKAGDGLQSLRWWKEGRLDLVEQYCRKDVEMTHRLYALGRERGYLLYRSRGGLPLRVEVAW